MHGGLLYVLHTLWSEGGRRQSLLLPEAAGRISESPLQPRTRRRDCAAAQPQGQTCVRFPCQCPMQDSGYALAAYLIDGVILGNPIWSGGDCFDFLVLADSA